MENEEVQVYEGQSMTGGNGIDESRPTRWEVEFEAVRTIQRARERFEDAVIKTLSGLDEQTRVSAVEYLYDYFPPVEFREWVLAVGARIGLPAGSVRPRKVPEELGRAVEPDL